jgi:hypothetical protein
VTWQREADKRAAAEFGSEADPLSFLHSISHFARVIVNTVVADLGLPLRQPAAG